MEPFTFITVEYPLLYVVSFRHKVGTLIHALCMSSSVITLHSPVMTNSLPGMLFWCV